MKLYVKLDWITNIHISVFLISWNLANDIRRISCLVCPQNFISFTFIILQFFCCRREEEKEKLELKVKLNQRRLQLNMGQKKSLSGSILKEILKNDVHLGLLKIAKMSSDIEMKKIKREKEKGKVSMDMDRVHLQRTRDLCSGLIWGG